MCEKHSKMSATACSQGQTKVHCAISDTSVCLKFFKIKGHRGNSPDSKTGLPGQMGSPVNFASKHFRKKQHNLAQAPRDREGNALPGRLSSQPSPVTGRHRRTEHRMAVPHCAPHRLGAPERAPDAGGRSHPVSSAWVACARSAPLTARVSPVAGDQPAGASMPCSL